MQQRDTIVALLHTHCNGYLTACMNGFVMPAFFFLSGFVFSYHRNPCYRPFVYKRFRQLVVPYLWINAVAYVAWVAVLRNYGNDAAAGTAWHEPLAAALLGIPPGLAHDIPLWSLLSFFMVEVIYYPLRRHLIKNDFIIAVLFFTIFALLSCADFSFRVLPLCLGPATGGIAYYALGRALRSCGKAAACVARPRWHIAPGALAAYAASVCVNGDTQFYINDIGNPFLFALTSCAGIVALIQISSAVSRILSEPCIVRLAARGTLLICGFHLLAFSAIKGVLQFGLGINYTSATDTIAHGILTALASVLLCLPVIWLTEKYLRPLIYK